MSMEFAQLPTTRYTDANSDFIRAAGPQGFQAYDYLFSSAQVNYLGIYPINTRLAASQTCMTEAELLRYIAAFEAAGLVHYDADNCLLWAVSAALRSIGELKQNPGKKGDNRIKMVNKAFAALPDRSPLKFRFYSIYSDMLKIANEEMAGRMRDPAGYAQRANEPAPTPPMAVPPAPAPAAAPPAAAKFKLSGTTLGEVKAEDLDAEMVAKWGYRDLLKTIQSLRELDREDYPASSEAQFKARAERLFKELGAPGATECLEWSMRNRDLDLALTMARVYPVEFTVEAGDI